MQPEQTCRLVEDIGGTDGVQDMFSKVWPAVTDPNPLVLFGFRRFRTSHLLNLRALEHEILEIDHQVFQADLQLGKPAPRRDRLALDHAEKDTPADATGGHVFDREKLERLRSLLQRYDEALAAFNRVMTMETFALADHQELAEQSNLTREETFRTRLIQVDRPVRNSIRDPIQHWLRKAFRSIWYYTLTSKPTVSNTSQSLSTASTIAPEDNNLEDGRPGIGTLAVGRRTWRSHQNTARLADAVSRFLFGLLTGVCLITPMVVLLGQEKNRPSQLTTVSISIVVFSLLVALASRASPQEMMGASAAYAAVLVVFVSTSNGGSAP